MARRRKIKARGRKGLTIKATAKPQATEIKADRILTDEELKRFDVELPQDWVKTPPMLAPGYPRRTRKPPGSGMGYVMSPYHQWYTLTYGVIPIADLPKYYSIYRNQPDVRHAIDLQAQFAMGRGFTVEHKNYDVETFLNDLLERTYVTDALFVAVKDALIAGSAFVEILWDEAHTEEEDVEIPPDIMGQIQNGNHPGIREYNALLSKGKIWTKDGKYFVKAEKIVPYTAQDFIAQKKSKKKMLKSVYPNIVGLKPLDPRYMRVRRDAFGSVYGYIQWLSWPPTIIRGEDMLHFRYSPTSTAYESAYGSSLLLPLIKNNDLLMQFENDMAIWMHNRVVLPFILKGGTPDKPYSVMPSENIIAFNDNDIHIESIEKFARFEGIENLPESDDQTLRPKTDILVPSFNKDNKMILSKVYGIYRHKYDGPIFEIKTRFNKTLKITAGHSIFKWDTSYKHPFMAYNKGKIISCSVNDLKVGDYIAVAKKLPVIEKPSKLSAGELWLLGMLIAEGDISSGHRIRWSTDSQNIEKIEQILIGMGYKPTKVKYKFFGGFGKFQSTSPRIYIHSKKFHDWLINLGFIWQRSSERTVPRWIIQLPLSQLKYFLKGLWDGDGYHNSKNRGQFSYTTASASLAESVQLILLRFGVISGVTESKTKFGTRIYDIYCYTSTTNFDEWDKIDPQPKLHGNALYHVEGDLALVKVQSIKKISSKSTWVYDFCVRNSENFITNTGIMAHNTRDQMKDLVDNFKNRTATSTVFLRGDVDVVELRGAAAQLRVEWWLQYLQRRRWVALGVPPVALGIQEPGGRLIGEVMFQAFIARIQKIQNQFGNEMVERLFIPLIAARFGEDIIKKFGKPKIVFRPVVEEDRNLRQARIIQATNSGILSVNEARVAMGYIPLRDKKYDTPVALALQQAEARLGMAMSARPEREAMPDIEKAPDVPKRVMAPQKPGGQPPQKQSLDMAPKAPRPGKPIREPRTNVVIKTDDAIKEELFAALNIVAFNLKNPGSMLIKDIKADAENKIAQIIDTHMAEYPKNIRKKYIDSFMALVDELIKRKNEIQAV